MNRHQTDPVCYAVTVLLAWAVGLTVVFRVCAAVGNALWG